MHNLDVILDEIKEHAYKCVPMECCGVVINFKGKLKYKPCNNKYPGINNFILDPHDYVEAEDMGDVMYIVHSHVNQPAIFSEVDIACMNKGNIPWALYSIAEDKLVFREPSEVVIDYIGRTYSYTVQDCFTLIQDYYKQEYNIVLEGPPRDDPRDPLLGAGLYRQFLDYGFKEIALEELRKGDCLIICNSSSEPNHAAIYLEGNIILHHPHGRLSCREVLGNFWLKNTWKCVRHKNFINDNS